MSPSINYEIRVARQSDSQDILEHMRKFFFRDAPLAAYLKIVTDENPICEDFEEASMKSMENPSLNLVAVSNGKIIGVCLNEIINRNYTEDTVQKEFKDKRYGMLDEFVSWFEKRANLFAKYPEFEEAFFVHNISVDSSYRGQGIAKVLFEKVM